MDKVSEGELYNLAGKWEETVQQQNVQVDLLDNIIMKFLGKHFSILFSMFYNMQHEDDECQGRTISVLSFRPEVTN